MDVSNSRSTKFRGMPTIRYINLDRSPDRQAFMEQQFSEWNVTDFRRFHGVDGKEVDFSDYIIGRHPGRVPGYIGGMLSHLSLIDDWLETTDEPYLMVMEDDCSFSGVAHWPFDWAEFFSRLPPDFDAVQLSVINVRYMVFRLHERMPSNWSSAAYIMTRAYAETLMRLHRIGSRYRFNRLHRQKTNTEDTLFGSGKTYTMPIFSYLSELGSLLHQHHIEEIHVPSERAFQRFWSAKAADVPDWSKMFDTRGALDPENEDWDTYTEVLDPAALVRLTPDSRLPDWLAKLLHNRGAM